MELLIERLLQRGKLRKSLDLVESE